MNSTFLALNLPLLPVSMVNSLKGKGAYMCHFLNYLHSRVSSDVGIWTEVTYASDYKSSVLALQHRSLKYSRSL